MSPWEGKTICYELHQFTSMGMFNGHYPLAYSTPLLMFQLVLATMPVLLVTFLLKPIGIPTWISQILGGMLLGPVGLGHLEGFADFAFPVRSLPVIHTYARVGSIFYLFLIGLQMDPWLIFKAGRKELVIGTSVVIVPLMLSTTCSIIMSAIFHIEGELRNSLLIVGIVQSMNAFPVIAYFLSEIKILNSEFSRIALSSAIFSSLLSFFALSCVIYNSKKIGELVLSFGGAAVILVVILFILRPSVLSMIRNIPEGQPLKEEQTGAIFLAILVLAYIGNRANLNDFFGPFLFGMVIPSGPPLGLALLDRLDFFITWMIMPVFYAQHGMTIHIKGITFKKFLVVQSIILISSAGKFLGAFLSSLYYNMSSTDAMLLGLTMNVQGIIELVLFQLLQSKQMIDNDCFVIMCISMLALTWISTRLVRYLYKSSRKYVLHNRRTIEHSLPNTEFRVVACIHDQENVPAIIHLLKASHPTKDSPISVSTIQLVELVGRATPMLISHKAHNGGSATNGTSQRILNVFSRYVEISNGTVSVHPFTVVSPYANMHSDICMLALNKRACLIIVPFHKQLTTGTINTRTRHVNCNVLDNAPCSVGILIDRGLLGGFKFVLANWLSYNVAVIFLGGNDDREALAYGLRMSEHPNINLTIIRVLDTSSTSNELDDAATNDFKIKTAYNSRVAYNEEEVVDRVGVINVIESMESKFELIILGRRHEEESLLGRGLGLTDWSKCTELGQLGDIFASAEYGGKATILVLQQHTSSSHTLKDDGPQSKLQNLNFPHNMLKEEVGKISIRRVDA